MTGNNDQPPRPPRSLRDKSSRMSGRGDLPPSDYINEEQKVIEKPDDFDDQAQSYLSQLDLDAEEKQIPDLPSVNNYNQSANKPKVQELNLRDNRRISTSEAKKETKIKIANDVGKIRDDFKNVGQAINETKEEIDKIGEKISQEVDVVKAKALAFGFSALEKLLTAPKDIMLGMVFKKKKSPQQVQQVKAQSGQHQQANISNTQKQSKREEKLKKIPKIKYASLIAKNIEFLTYDKKRLVGDGDTGSLLEQIFMANALSDIHYCVKYVLELPQATQGIYAGKPIADIFEVVTPEDINFFLYYVERNPEAFMKTRYKFSEAFATWIIRKSHET